EPFVLAALIMTTILHSIAAVSRSRCQYILRTLEVVLYGAFVWCNTQSGNGSELTIAQDDLVNSLPEDVRTALSHLGLEPEFLRYACC
ncbi:hypothetical protein C8Q76DRAFT_576339, partial [Earliella scabrosa]